tara:strand:- start:743 stop:2308 length:1566 start_codon:yes stop_codon:yes gene_type:complete
MNLGLIYNNRTLVVFVIPIFLGILTIFSFQPFNFTIINFLLLPIFFLILTYVGQKSKYKYRKKPFYKNLFFVGYFFGLGFFFSGTYWISYSLTFDKSFEFLIPFSLILIPAFLGLFFGLSTLLAGIFIKNNFISILFFCSILSFFDFVRAKILTGFPWNIWAYSWSWFPEILQSLNTIGIFAFNLLVLIFFCSPLLLIFKKNNYNFFIFIVLLLTFFSNYILGSRIMNKEMLANNNLDKVKINNTNMKLISPKFDLKYNLTDKDIEKSIKKLIKYSEPKKESETIFVWPEGVFTGFYFSDLIKYKDLFLKNFSSKHMIILGANTMSPKKNVFNSFIVINNKFEILYQYNKKKLVPFGEFLPFKDTLQKIGLKKITQGHGSFTKGIDQENFKIKNLNILPLLCYEIIFTELVQNKNNESNLIINISEDAWFGGSIGPHQHFAKSIFRAIENDTYLVRVANKGVTAFISNTGKVIKRLEPDEAGNIELNIPILNNNSKNRNDLIFFTLLFTYTIIFFTLKKNY